MKRPGLFRQPALPLFSWHTMLATWGGSGLFRKMPGTTGSLAALPFAFLLLWAGGPVLLGAAALVLFAVGVWTAGVYGEAEGNHDSNAIVIDEVVGQWVALLAASLSWPDFILGFALFRLFDILKPWPIRWLDANIHGGLGVMLDDLAAGSAALVSFILIQQVI